MTVTTDPFVGLGIILVIYAAFLAFGNYFVYCMVYVDVWRHFPNIRPYTERKQSSAPWRKCWIGSTTRYYVQLNDSSVNVIFWWTMTPFASRLRGMAEVPMSEVQLISPGEMVLLCQSATPLRVILDEPLSKPKRKQQVSVYCDGTVITNWVIE